MLTSSRAGIRISICTELTMTTNLCKIIFLRGDALAKLPTPNSENFIISPSLSSLAIFTVCNNFFLMPMPRKIEGCHWSVLSCARCRAKKIKVILDWYLDFNDLILTLQCDGGAPCSQCRAYCSRCTGNCVDGTNDIPRSITQFLQAEIRILESWAKFHNTNEILLYLMAVFLIKVTQMFNRQKADQVCSTIIVLFCLRHGSALIETRFTSEENCCAAATDMHWFWRYCLIDYMKEEQSDV